MTIHHAIALALFACWLMVNAHRYRRYRNRPRRPNYVIQYRAREGEDIAAVGRLLTHFLYADKADE